MGIKNVKIYDSFRKVAFDLQRTNKTVYLKIFEKFGNF